LQQELHQKEELYQLLRNDFNRLDLKYQESLKNQSRMAGSAHDPQIKVLEEEIAYLKKHFEIELGLMKDENDILRKELLEVNTSRRKHHQQNSSHTPNRHRMPIHNYCSPIRMADLDDLSGDKNHLMHRGISDNNLNNSALISRQPNHNGQIDRLKNEVLEKDRMLE
jgi:hypothetical protein